MIKKMDFICAIDVQPSQTAWMADIILPETTYLERLDPLWATPARQKFIAMRQPVVKPQHEAKTLLNMIKGIAKRLDKKHEFETSLVAAFDFTMEDYIDAQLKGAPVDRATLMRDGLWTEADIKYTIGDFRSGKKKFDTPSGKVEFVSERFARNGYPPLPSYTPPKEESGKQRLVTGRHAWFTHTSNQNNAWLHDLYPENELWINPEVARGKGIASGDYVKVRSAVGEARVKALVTTKIRKDTVFLCHGFGSEVAGQKLAYRKGASDELLMKSHADVISNNQAMHETFVDVVKA
jgi:thiosulfate reductase/polysulfide reductase chain A